MAELLDYNTVSDEPRLDNRPDWYLGFCEKLIDRLNISSNEQDIKKDYLHLKAQNDAQTKGLDELFIEKGK